jgi:transcriptional regulator with XRE-family HTH domain
MEKIDLQGIIQRIRELREQFSGPRGRSEFARALAISPSTYNYYERDRIPPIEVLLRICEVTGADIEWLLTGQESAKKFAFAKKIARAEPGEAAAAGANSVLLRKLDALLNENPDLGAAVSAFVDLLADKKALVKSIRDGYQCWGAPQRGWCISGTRWFCRSRSRPLPNWMRL